jgi:hypothetical protein
MRGAWAIGVVLTGLGCRGGDGEPCAIDSDCLPGLVCGLEGVCQSMAAVEGSFRKPDAVADPAPEVEITGPETAEADVQEGEASACGPSGVFEAATPPCPEPSEKKPVKSLVLPESGHGMAGLAVLANPIIANGFEEGTLAYEAWVDGQYRAGCDPAVAWVRPGQPDRNQNCTAVWLVGFPFAIPGLVAATIYQVAIDPASSRLSGLADEEEILQSMDPALRATADSLITEDVDTDGDQKPDKISVLIDVGFE